MKNQTIDVLWHDITDVAELDLYLGPDTFDTETVVTAICGDVNGELDRVVSRDQDGVLVMRYEARVDGLGDGEGVAKVESDSSDELMCLAAVAGFLAREMNRLTGCDDGAPAPE